MRISIITFVVTCLLLPAVLFGAGIKSGSIYRTTGEGNLAVEHKDSFLIFGRISNDSFFEFNESILVTQKAGPIYSGERSFNLVLFVYDSIPIIKFYPDSTDDDDSIEICFLYPNTNLLLSFQFYYDDVYGKNCHEPIILPAKRHKSSVRLVRGHSPEQIFINVNAPYMFENFDLVSGIVDIIKEMDFMWDFNIDSCSRADIIFDGLTDDLLAIPIMRGISYIFINSDTIRGQGYEFVRDSTTSFSHIRR